MKKFALHPGYIISDNDKEKHYVSGTRLARILKLKPNEYIVWDTLNPNTYRGKKWDNYYHIFVSRTSEEYRDTMLHIQKLKQIDKIKNIINNLENTYGDGIYIAPNEFLRIKEDGKFYINDKEFNPLNDLIKFINKLNDKGE